MGSATDFGAQSFMAYPSDHSSVLIPSDPGFPPHSKSITQAGFAVSPDGGISEGVDFTSGVDLDCDWLGG